MSAYLQQRVRIVGLSARPDLNGQEGLCTAFEADRYSVSVNKDHILRVKPANLELLVHCPASSTAPKKRGSDVVDLTEDSELSSSSSSSSSSDSEFEDSDVPKVV